MDEIATYSELVRDHRTVFKLITDPLQIYEIVARIDGKRYLVFNISLWHEDDDAEKTAVHVSSRALKDNAAFIFNCCRDQMFNLCVDIRGHPKYIIEPRAGAGRWIAARLGLADRAAWSEAVLGGRLMTAMDVEHPNELAAELDAALRKARTARKRMRRQDADLAEGRTAHVELRRVHADKLGELGRIRDDRMTKANQAASNHARVRQLTAYIEANSLPVPPWGNSGFKPTT